MPKAWRRHVNLRAMLVVLIGVGAFAGGVHILHKQQVKRNIAGLLGESNQAEQEGDLNRAQEVLEVYLSAEPNDARAWSQFARLMEQRNPVGRVSERLYAVYEQAVRLNPDDHQLRERAAEVALKLNRTREARAHLARLFNASTEGKADARTRARAAEALAQCVMAEAGSSQSSGPLRARSGTDLTDLPTRSVEEWYRTAIELDPSAVSAYQGLVEWFFKDPQALADQAQGHAQRVQKAESVLNELVSVNPGNAQAYVTRYRLSRVYLPTADAKDARKAYELDPDDADAQEVAVDALVADGRVDQALVVLTKAEESNPQDSRFPRLRAQLELRNDRAEEAESILRRACDRLPSTEIAALLMLTELLIGQGQVEGPGGARELVSKLRDRGLSRGLLLMLDGRMAMRQGRWAEAVKKLTQAGSLLTTDLDLSARVTLLIAECHAALNQPLERLNVLRAASDRPGLTVKLAYAQALAAQGDFEEALREHLSLRSLRSESRVDAALLTIQCQLQRPQEKRDWSEVKRRIADAFTVLPENDPRRVLLMADELLARGKREEAERALESAWSRTPADVQLTQALVSVLEKGQEWDEALDVLTRSETASGSKPSPKLVTARLNLALKRGGDAVRPALVLALETATRLPQSERNALLNQVSDAAYRAGEFQLARQAWERLTQDHRFEIGPLVNLAQLAIETADQPLFDQVIPRIRGLDRQDGSLVRMLEGTWALAAVQRGGVLDAAWIESQARELESTRPDWWGGSLLRAQLAEIQGQPDLAVSQFQKVIERGNTQPAVVQHLVGLLQRQNRTDEIEAIATKLKDQGVDTGNLKLVQAVGLIQRNTAESIESGLAAAREVLRADSGRATDHLIYGRLLQSVGKLGEAESSLARAVALTPGNADAWFAYVQVLMKSGQDKKARTLVEQLRRQRHLVAFPQALAAIHTLIGDAVTADALYATALQEHPGDTATIQAVAAHQLEQGDASKAQALLGQLVDPSAQAPAKIVAWARRAQAIISLTTSRRGFAGWQEAMSAIESNLKVDPGSYDDRSALAALLAVHPGRHAEAIAEFESLAATSPLSDDHQFLWAKLLNAEGKNVACGEVMKPLLDRPRPDPKHLVFYISSLLQNRQTGPASHWIEVLEQADPGNISLFQAKAELLSQQGRKPDLLQMLTQRLAEHPEQTGPLVSMLETYGFYAEAEAALRDWASLGAEPARQLALIGFLGRHDRPDEAIGVLDALGSQVPADQVAESSLAIYVAPSAKVSHKERVESLLHQAIQISPDRLVLRSKLALIRVEQGRHEEAERLFREVLERDPDHLGALNDLAWLLALQPEPGLVEALKHINHAIEIAGPLPGLLDTRAVVRLRTGDFEGALQDLPSSPTDAKGWLHLAWARHAAGQLAPAREALAQARQSGFEAEKLDRLERPHVERWLRDLDKRSP